MNQNTMIENDILLVIEDIINKVESEFIPTDKIEKLRSSLKNLKNKTSIKIRNGEIIK